MEVLKLKKLVFELNKNLEMREVMAQSEEEAWTHAVSNA